MFFLVCMVYILYIAPSPLNLNGSTTERYCFTTPLIKIIIYYTYKQSLVVLKFQTVSTELQPCCLPSLEVERSCITTNTS